MSNLVKTAPAAGLKAFNQFITNENTAKYLSEVLADQKSTFVTNLVGLVANNKLLQDCEPSTVMFAAIKATALNLPLDQNLGYAYVIPYNSRQADGSYKKEAQFQIGYKGFLQLAQRSGVIKSFHFTEIREGEMRNYDLLRGTFDIVAAPNREKLPVVGYSAWVMLNNGFEHTFYMSVLEVRKHAEDFSKTYQQDIKKGTKTSVWSSNFDAMARKTVIKGLFQSGIITLSVDMIDANKADQAVLRDKSMNANYVDNNTEDAVAQEIQEEANQGQEMSFDEAQDPQQPAQPAAAEEVPDVFKE